MFSARTILIWAVPILIGAPLTNSSARAQQPRVVAEEVREFEILVKGQNSGKCQIKITDTDDGTTLVTTDATVSLDYVVYTYRYEFHGKEDWHEDRLIWTDSVAVDAGKKLSARAQVDARGSTIEANGRTNRTSTILDMTTSYWRVPHAGAKNAMVSLLNADRGTIYSAKMEYVGIEPVSVMDRKRDCTHFRFSGDVTVDIWLDDHGRIVWQKAIETGYPTELRLKRLINNVAIARSPASAAQSPASARR